MPQYQDNIILFNFKFFLLKYIMRETWYPYNSKLDPDAEDGVNIFRIYPDDDFLVTSVINSVCEAVGIRKRFRKITLEEAVRAWGFYTPEQARNVADRMILDDETMNYCDPKRSKLSIRIQKKLGLLT